MIAFDKSKVRQAFLDAGFTIKEGQEDLKDYVYSAAANLMYLVSQDRALAEPLGVNCASIEVVPASSINAEGRHESFRPGQLGAHCLCVANWAPENSSSAQAFLSASLTVAQGTGQAQLLGGVWEGITPLTEEQWGSLSMPSIDIEPLIGLGEIHRSDILLRFGNQGSIPYDLWLTAIAGSDYVAGHDSLDMFQAFVLMDRMTTAFSIRNPGFECELDVGINGKVDKANPEAEPEGLFPHIGTGGIRVGVLPTGLSPDRSLMPYLTPTVAKAPCASVCCNDPACATTKEGSGQ